MALTGRMHLPADVDTAKTTLLHITGKGILKSISCCFWGNSHHGTSYLYLNVDSSGERLISPEQFSSIIGAWVGPNSLPFLSPTGGGMVYSTGWRGTILLNLPFTTSLVVSAKELNDIAIMYILDV